MIAQAQADIPVITAHERDKIVTLGWSLDEDLYAAKNIKLYKAKAKM